MTTWNSATTASPYHGFVASEMDDNLSGPFKYPRLVTVTDIPDSGTLVGVDTTGKILHTNLENMRTSSSTSPGATLSTRLPTTGPA